MNNINFYDNYAYNFHLLLINLFKINHFLENNVILYFSLTLSN